MCLGFAGVALAKEMLFQSSWQVCVCLLIRQIFRLGYSRFQGCGFGQTNSSGLRVNRASLVGFDGLFVFVVHVFTQATGLSC